MSILRVCGAHPLHCIGAFTCMHACAQPALGPHGSVSGIFSSNATLCSAGGESSIGRSAAGCSCLIRGAPRTAQKCMEPSVSDVLRKVAPDMVVRGVGILRRTSL